MMKMTLDEAKSILTEIALGDQEKYALETLIFACDNYRAMYEGAEKRILRYRDVAGRPDIPEHPNAPVAGDEKHNINTDE